MVTEHQAEVKVCPCCAVAVKASFPKPIAAMVQYGERLKAQIAYLSSYQLLPVGRLAELIGDFYGQSVSEETVFRILASLSAAVEPSLEAIQAQLVQAAVVHGDETSLRVAGQTQWLHVLSTPDLTYYGVQRQRGQAAMRVLGLIEQLVGYFVHDAYASYFVFDQCQHYLHLLQVGQQANPPLEKPVRPKRGRQKHSLAQNLLLRLEKYQAAVLAFIHDFRVPFDNNLAERD